MGGGSLPGVVTKAAVINIGENTGTLSKVDTTSNAANGLSKALSLLGGGGSISANSADYTFMIDKAAYSTGALNGMRGFNAEVAKALAGQ